MEYVWERGERRRKKESCFIWSHVVVDSPRIGMSASPAAHLDQPGSGNDRGTRHTLSDGVARRRCQQRERASYVMVARILSRIV